MSDLHLFDATKDYLIADDFDFKYFPNKKQWWGAQKEFTATDKYHRKVTISWGKPLLYLCNPDSDPRGTPEWSAWFDDNTVAIDITSPLFQ